MSADHTAMQLTLGIDSLVSRDCSLDNLTRTLSLLFKSRRPDRSKDHLVGWTTVFMSRLECG
jgi:hypothetical protein